MKRKTEPSWQHIAFDSWLLGTEACMVVALRLNRLARGGPDACDEAKLMVTEKLESAEALASDLIAGRLGSTPDRIVGNAVAHFRQRVGANRRRLAR